jgi:hypothetical protein
LVRVSAEKNAATQRKVRAILTFTITKNKILSGKQAVSLWVTGKQHKNNQPVYFFIT